MVKASQMPGLCAKANRHPLYFRQHPIIVNKQRRS
jgi:hypothetical protein